MKINYENDHEKILHLKLDCERASEVSSIKKWSMLHCKFIENQFEAYFLFIHKYKGIFHAQSNFECNKIWDHGVFILLFSWSKKLIL